MKARMTMWLMGVVVFGSVSLVWGSFTPLASQDLTSQIDLNWGSTQLISNGGFEDAGWYNTGRSTLYKNSGAQSGTLTGGVNSSVIISGLDPTGTYTFTGYGARDTYVNGYPRIIINTYIDDANDIRSNFFYSWVSLTGFESWTTDFTLGSNYSSARIWLMQGLATGIGYFDDLSLRPKNLYVYRSTSSFTNTGEAGVQLIATLAGTAGGYQDPAAAGTYWYAVTATASATDVGSVMGTSVPEPISMLLLGLGGLGMLRRRILS